MNFFFKKNFATIYNLNKHIHFKDITTTNFDFYVKIKLKIIKKFHLNKIK